MPKMQTTCPRCRNPLVAEVEQLFDLSTDPRAKQKLMSGTVNFVHCPNCGYEGSLGTPIVYHDPDKELLLTYFPPEAGVSVNQQEKLIGPLIKRVLDNLPQEKRKGYLFKPQAMFTMQTMIEKILAADGITKEMLEKQQAKAKLIERLVLATQDSRLQIIKQEENQIDDEFFALLSRLIQLTISQGDQEGAKKLTELQKTLIENTSTGRAIEEKTREIDAAVKSLQEASKEGLTREKLLNLIVNAESETRLAMLVSLARQGLDYQFFEMLTKKIDQSSGDEKKRLEEIRGKILDMTREIDQAIQGEMVRARKQLDEILSSKNIEEAMQKNVDQISDYFVEVVRSELELARRTGDMTKIDKLQQVANFLEDVSGPPPEVHLIEEMLTIENNADLEPFFKSHSEEITPELLQMMNNVILQSEQQGQSKELVEKLQNLYRAVLKFSMRINLQK